MINEMSSEVNLGIWKEDLRTHQGETVLCVNNFHAKIKDIAKLSYGGDVPVNLLEKNFECKI